MALGDGIRRNIAHVDPAERALLRDALVALNGRFFPGSRTDAIPGGVSWWFKQDETHQATHVHGGPEFLPWHREIVNRFEALIRQINPQLSLHYWDWTQDPRSISNANLGGGTTGTLNLFTSDFMGYGGSSQAEIGEPWKSAGYYVPGAAQHRDSTNNPADPPEFVRRSINGSPASASDDTDIVNAANYPAMRNLLEDVHNAMHGFVAMGGQHISFRDPFVFLLHSNVDRLFAKWQTEPGHSDRLDPALVYGAESGGPALNGNIEPWSGGLSIRPWAFPENQGDPKNYKHSSIIFPPCYDTNGTAVPIVQVMNAGMPPVVNFNDVPTGETAVRAATFRIYGCGDVTVRVKAGAAPAAPYSVLHPVSGSATVHHGANLYAEARIWLAFTAGAAGVPVADGSVTFECPENGREFTFVLKANAINRPRVAVMLALDQSGSMGWAAGTSGALRIDVLKDAARKFMEVIPANNGVGLIRFDHNSYAVNDPTYPGLDVTAIATNNMFDVGRVAAINAVNNHAVNPAGNTSVGDGVDRARQVLNAVAGGTYDHKALVVLTDGLENDPLWISDVAGSIDSRTFAIGLGNEVQVNTAALNSLANGTGGYLMLTGVLSSSIDDYFRLSKYFMQILAGVTNNNIILDPSGYVTPGSKIRIPFRINEADIDATALLMTDYNVVDFAVEAPDGSIIDPAAAAGLAVSYNTGAQTRSYRFTLPVAVGAGQHDGTWYARLQIDGNEFKRTLAKLREQHGQLDQTRPNAFTTLATHGARYSVVVQTYSNLRLVARTEQNSYEPGATLQFAAELTEYGIPVDQRARVDIELTRPNGVMTVIQMMEVEPGIFEASASASFAGIYQARFLARGVTLRGTPFTREQTTTSAVWRGGDHPYQPPKDSGDSRDYWCRLLTCILSEKNFSREFEELAKRQGINLKGIRQCLHSLCNGGRRGA